MWTETTFIYLEKHTATFEQDLSQLTEQLQELTFVDIYGKVHEVKSRYYREMVHRRFPNSRSDVTKTRFRLWL